MITRIVLFAVIIGIVIFILSKKLKKHLISLVIIALLVVAASIVSGRSAIKNDINTVIDDAELIGSYEDIGNVYYDENDNMYFVIKMNPWNLIDTFERSDIDYNLGEMVHTVTDFVDYVETLIEKYK